MADEIPSDIRRYMADKRRTIPRSPAKKKVAKNPAKKKAAKKPSKKAGKKTPKKKVAKAPAKKTRAAKPKGGKTSQGEPIKYLSEAQVDRLLAAPAVDAIRDRLIISTLLLLGLRRQELCDLIPEDFDGEHYTVQIRHAKGDRWRVINVPHPLFESLQEFMRKWRVKDGERVFGLRWGGTVNDKIIKRWAKACGLPSWVTAHTMRHTHAVQSLLAGVDIVTLSKDLGHVDIATTVRHYLGLIASDRAIVRRDHPLKWSMDSIISVEEAPAQEVPTEEVAA